MEVTVLSAQGLKTNSLGLFSHRLRPFITLTIYPQSTRDHKESRIYTTRVDDQGEANPTWDDKFHVPIDTSFFVNRYSCVYLQLYTKRRLLKRVQLGWFQIPVSDIGYPMHGSVRYLSYRIRGKDGTLGHGIVNLAIKLTGCLPVNPRQRLSADLGQKVQATCQTVIGMPVTAMYSLMNISH